MKFIDTHAHLYHKQFRNDRAEMVQRCLDLGVEEVYLPAIDSAYHEPMFEMVEKWPGFCFPMMGVHPCSIKADFAEELEIARKWLFEPDRQIQFSAVGEIGLDYHWSTEFVEEQKAAFQQQIDWAKELELPIVIHARKSLDDCIEMVERNNEGLRGVFHCYSGSKAQTERALATGFFLGIGGVATYKNSGLKELLPEVPLERIVLETDAPYLAPIPHRGKRNESSYIPKIAQTLAEIYGKTLPEIAEVTTANAHKLFPQAI